MKIKLLFAVAIALSLSAAAQTNSQTTLAVEPMSPTPIFRVTVVSRSVQAVNYKHRGGATKLELLLHCGPQMGCFNANKKSLNANKIRENR